MKDLKYLWLVAIFCPAWTSINAADVVNVSARSSVGAGEETFFVSFVVTGEPGELTPILALGSGPVEHIENPIADPNLTLFQVVDGKDSEVIGSNDNWMEGGQMLALSSTGIAPSLEASSGMIAWVEPGAYSAALSDNAGNGGIGVAEIYEMVFKDIPNSIIDAADFETLVAALVAATPSADLISLLASEGPFTVFAPTDAAFAALPDGTLDSLLADPATLADILSYHVVAAEVPASAVTNSKVEMANGDEAILQVTEAGGVIIQGANVVEADFYATNGVVHVIDSVILPPTGDENIVDVLSAAGNFSTLIQAAIDTGAAATLVTDGPFTLFAPTDDAFAAIADTVASLSNEQLLDILLYHVVVGAQVPAADVTAGMVEMGNGAMATLATDDGVTINGTSVILADLFGSNGVVHVIDSVILPPAM